MAEKRPSGVLLAMTRCNDVSKEDEYNRWYIETHHTDIIGTGTHYTATRYINTDPNPGDNKFLSYYETDWEDPLAAFPQLLKESAKFPMHPELRGGFVGDYKYIGPEQRISRSPAKAPETRGLTLTFTQCTDPAREADYNKWCDTVHISDVVETDGVIAGHRFFNAGLKDEGRRYLALYEIADDDVDGVHQRVLATLRSKPKDHFIDYMKATHIERFRRLG